MTEKITDYSMDTNNNKDMNIDRNIDDKITNEADRSRDMDKSNPPALSEEYEFSISMALVDFLPVIFFFVGGIFVYRQISSILYIVGVILCTFAGVCKAGWKLITSSMGKNYKILPKLFHICMPLGFALIVISILTQMGIWVELIKRLFIVPSLFFTLTGCLGMVMMIIFAIKLDGTKARSNWIEQITNTIAQLCFLIALLVI